MPRSRFGTEITHCRIGTGGMRWSARCAAVWDIRRPVHDGQTPRPLHENATRKPTHHRHANESHECVGFVTSLLRGTEWAATGGVTLPVPDDFPTADATRQRSLAAAAP